MRQKVLIVLGMHRSGTSLVTRVLNLLVVFLGTRLMAPFASNPKGHWEHADIAPIHDRLLLSIAEREWHTVLPMPDQWWLDPNVRPFRAEILSVLTRDFSDSPFWGIKDPRMCRLLPLWKPILADMNCQPYFVHVTRNPCEVAASLERRDNINPYKSVLMWFQHVTEAEVETRGFPRTFVTFSQFLSDWESTTKSIAQDLGIEWSTDSGGVRPEIDTFIDATLKHHSESDEMFLQRPEIPSFVSEAYVALVRAAHEPGYDVSEGLSRSTMKYKDEIRSCFVMLEITADMQGKSSAPPNQVVAARDAEIREKDARIAAKDSEIAAKDAEIAARDAEIGRKDAEIAERNAQIAEKDDRIVRREAEIVAKDAEIGLRDVRIAAKDASLESILNSKSWRLTAPFRAILERVRRNRTD